MGVGEQMSHSTLHGWSLFIIPPFFWRGGLLIIISHTKHLAPESDLECVLPEPKSRGGGAQHFSISMPHPAVCRRQQLGSESPARTWPWTESQVFELEVSQLSLLCLGFRRQKEMGGHAGCLWWGKAACRRQNLRSWEGIRNVWLFYWKKKKSNTRDHIECPVRQRAESVARTRALASTDSDIPA